MLNLPFLRKDLIISFMNVLAEIRKSVGLAKNQSTDLTKFIENKIVTLIFCHIGFLIVKLVLLVSNALKVIINYLIL